MGSLLCTLPVIRRLCTLGTILGSRFKCLGLLFAKLFALLSRKLATCPLWYDRYPVASQKPKPAQSPSTWEHPGYSNPRGLAAVASSVSEPSGSPAIVSRASIPPDVGRSTFTPAINSRRGYSISMPASIPQNSGTMIPEQAEDIHLHVLDQRIDVTPIPVGAGSLQEPERVLSLTHLTPSYTPKLGPNVFPMNPGDTSRYARRSTTSRDVILKVIGPLTTTFPHVREPNVLNQVVNESFGTWTPATHPEGALYFYDKERRLFTDTDMRDETLRGEAEHFYGHLQTLPEAKELTNSSREYDLVLEIKPDQIHGFKWFYYYICHTNQCPFWLEEYHITDMVQRVGVQSLAHIKHQLEYLYWYHWSLFPVNFDQRRLSKKVYDELLGMLVYGCIDVMTSKTSTLWLDDNQMKNMIGLIQDAKVASAGEVYYTAGTTRLLSLFAQWRFLDFHGQTNARLNRYEAIYHGSSHRRSILIIVLSPLLFLAPQKYLAELEEAWIDEQILAPVWKGLMTKMLGEWSDLILWSTVMLSANVGLLAVPGVLPSNNNATTPATGTTLATLDPISNYLSLISSVGSIVVGLLLIRHHRTKKEEDPVGAARYLSQNDHSYFGLEPMAVVFSLPWALLMWAMMLFSIELLILCFNHTDLQLRLSIGIVSTFVAAPIIWCMWNSWEAKLNTETY